MSWEDEVVDQFLRLRKEEAKTNQKVARQLAERRLAIEEVRQCLINGLLHPQPTVPILRKIMTMALNALPPERTKTDG